MSHYLIDHPPASRQFGDRHEAETGCVVVHTPESFVDVHPPDDGAENVASFISTRTDPGSYHEVVDSDSYVPLIPDHLRAFHVAATGVNQWTWGISICTSAADWGLYPAWDSAALLLTGDRIAAYLARWATRNGDVSRAWEGVGWITAAEAHAGKAGLIHHGQFQADRTDAWEIHPLRAILDGVLATNVAASLARLLSPPTEPREVPVLIVVRNNKRYLMFPDGLLIDLDGAGPPGVETWEPGGAQWKRLVSVNRSARLHRGNLDVDAIPAK